MTNNILTLSGEPITNLVTAGKCDWVDSNINQEKFPLDPSLDGKWEWDLYNPSSRGSQKAFDEMSVDGWMPATVVHLLAFGVKYPEAQKVNPIIALGSSYCGFGDRDVPVLYLYGASRRLDLFNWSGAWFPSYRFLRVRRLPA